MHSDLAYIGNYFDGHQSVLPEVCMPLPANTYVLVSCIYDYQFKNIRSMLESKGINKEHIVHAKRMAAEILRISADYYSQNGMDRKALTLFENIGKDISSVRYLDAGSNMWMMYNNSYLFYRLGASGVLVEANPDFVEETLINRPRDTAIMCGCSDVKTSEEWTYYKTNHAGYNTFVKEIAAKFKDKNLDVQEIKVPMKYIGDILDENFSSRHIDYLSVDIEGMGARVVNAIDFSKFIIDVILLEMDTDDDISRNLYVKLPNLGYIAQWRNIGNKKDFLFYRKDVFGKVEL